MIYDSFPIMLLSALASEKKQSTNSVIACYILDHLSEAGSIDIRVLAKNCHVGTGTVSRFCRDMGFDSFAQLKELLNNTAFSFQTAQAPTYKDRARVLAERTGKAVEKAALSIDEEKVRKLCRDIRKYKKVSAFGMLKAENAAIDLQVDLLMQGKRIDTCFQFSEQAERILSADSDELIIVFSYTGEYFTHPDFRGAANALSAPRIWMVCGKLEQKPDFVNDVILFDSDGDRLGHPYQLEIAAGLLAQEYAAMSSRMLNA